MSLDRFLHAKASRYGKVTQSTDVTVGGGENKQKNKKKKLCLVTDFQKQKF